MAELAEHVEYLVESGYTALHVSAFADAVRSRAALPDKPVLLTFDDGYADFHTNAFPVMAARGVPSTLYMITGRADATKVGEDKADYLSWSQLRELHAAGVEIGSHSETHPQLDTVPLWQARQEIQASKAMLEDRLGHEVSSFAYPYGYYSPLVRSMVVEAGYRSACAVKQALSAPDDDLFALSRVFVRGGVRSAQLEALMTRGTRRIVPIGERLAIIGWRYVRRSHAAVRRTFSARRLRAN
jgi:peptidoglycan/xylan/chitin deacetylase (PgdA/CDA1 family)